MTQQSSRDAIKSEFADDTDMIELVEMFVSEMPDRIEALSGAIKNGEMDAVERLAHQLKGASGGYGFPMLSEAATELERTVKSGELDAVRERVDDLVEMCRRVIV